MAWNRGGYRRRYVKPEKTALELRIEARRAEEALISPKYIQAEGPMPEDVWGASTIVETLRSNAEGESLRILRQMPSGGLYIQEAGNIGWHFYPCIFIGD